MITKTGFGQDSHRFDKKSNKKKLKIAGIDIPDSMPLRGNSDADVVLHAITNAFSSISATPILGARADVLCLQENITDSKIYLQEALDLLKGYIIDHIAISIECSTPKILPHILKMRESIASMVKIDLDCVGITATSGEELTEFGKGEGIQFFAVVTARKKYS